MNSEKNKLSGAEHFAQELVGLGVKLAFIVPGGKIAPVVREITESNEITVIATVREEGAIFMAAGAARTLLRPADEPVIAVVTAGPGILNAIPAMVSAAADHVPLIVIGGIGSEEAERQGCSQHVEHLATMLRGGAKAVSTICSARNIRPTVHHAKRIALEEPRGPVVILVPLDVQIGNE